MTTIPKITLHPMKDILCKGVGKGGWGGGVGRGVGLKPPPDFKVMLLCVQAVTAKGHPKCIIKKQERKKQLSGCKQCYTYKNQSLEMS